MTCALLAQGEGEGIAPLFITETEPFQFSEETDSYFHEELSFENDTPIQLATPSELKINALPCGDGGWRVCFEFPAPVVYKQEGDRCDICLEFNQAISSADFSQTNEALGYLVSSFDIGYNTLHLGTSRPVFFCTQHQDRVFILDIYPDYTGTTAFIPRTLKVARAKLLMDARFYAPAYCALGNLLCEYPGDRDTGILLTDLESVIPRWQKSVAILRTLREQFPYDASIQASLHDVFYPHSSYIRFEETTIRYVHEAVEHFWRVNGEWIINCSPCQYLYLGGTFEQNRGNIRDVTQSDGTVQGFHGNRLQGNLYLREEFSSGCTLTGIAYATEGVVMGAGARVSWLIPIVQGEIALTADWHKPYWDIYEAFAHFGREDKLKVDFSAVFSRFFNYYINAGVHRVGIDQVTNGFSSVLLSSSAFWHFYVNAFTDIELQYAFDAEYVYSGTRKIGIDGQPFSPISLSSYEFHTVKCNYVHICRYWELRAGVGYTINRLGTGGLNAELGLFYRKPCPCGWELALLASQFPSTTQPGTTQQNLSISVTKRF